MELKQYLKIVKKNLLLVLVLSVAGAVLALLLTKSLGSGFFLTQTFYVSSPIEGSPEYAGFYTQEKARNFTDTAVAILESLDFKKELVSSGDLITTQKVAPQVVRVTTTSQDRQRAKALMGSTVDSFNTKIQKLSGNQPQIQLKELASSDEPQKITRSKLVFAAAGLVLGATAAILTVSLKTYFRL